MRKVEIGRTYELFASDYRQVTPLKYNEVSKTYTCKVVEPVAVDNVDNDDFIVKTTDYEYEAELTAHDILYV